MITRLNITLKTPVQIFINGKFFCIANEVEIKRNSPEFKKSLIPDNVKQDPSQWTGTVVHIKKPPTTKAEKKKIKKKLKTEPYDEFFRRMVNAKDDPNAHLPID